MGKLSGTYGMSTRPFYSVWNTFTRFQMFSLKYGEGMEKKTGIGEFQTKGRNKKKDVLATLKNFYDRSRKIH